MEETFVILVKPKATDDDMTQKAVESFVKLLTAQKSTVEIVYQGKNEKVIIALRSILELAK